MMSSKLGLLAATLVVCLLVLPAQAALTVCDDFNGSALDPAWVVSLGGSSVGGSTYGVSGGNFNLTGLLDSTQDSTWATMTFKRPISLTGNFQATLTFTWDTFGNNHAIDALAFQVLDAGGNVLASAEYYDMGYNAQAGKNLVGGASSSSTGSGALTAAGGTTFSLSRASGLIKSDFGDGTSVTSASVNNVAGAYLAIVTRTYKSSLYPAATFPTFTLSQIQSTDPTIGAPEPASLSLLCLAAVGVVRRRRK